MRRPSRVAGTNRDRAAGWKSNPVRLLPCRIPRGFHNRRALRHLGAGARACGQVALGLELGVALDDQSARNPKRSRERSRRRQARVRLQPTGADRRPQLFLELNVQRSPRLPVQRHQQVKRGSGPLIWHRSGPYSPDRFPRSVAAMLHPALLEQLTAARIDDLRRCATKNRQADSSPHQIPAPRHAMDMRADAAPHTPPASGRHVTQTATPQLQIFTASELRRAIDPFKAEDWNAHTFDAERGLRTFSDMGCTTLVALDGARVVAVVQLQPDGEIQLGASRGKAKASPRSRRLSRKQASVSRPRPSRRSPLA